MALQRRGSLSWVSKQRPALHTPLFYVPSAIRGWNALTTLFRTAVRRIVATLARIACNLVMNTYIRTYVRIAHSEVVRCWYVGA